MNNQISELKITSWKYKGFKTPDVTIKIDDPNGKRNFTLLQMLSGEGKTTTLNLLRNSFYDINKKLNPTEIKKYINQIRSDDQNIEEGDFEVSFLLNNEINYRVKIIFDYKNEKISYNTFKGDGTGFEEGINLPENINRFITPEFLEISFFDLEFTDNLYKAEIQQTDKIIKKLCKLDYLDEISNSLEAFIKNFRKKNIGKLKDKELERSADNLERIKKHYENVVKKAEQENNKKINLKKKLEKITSELEEIKNEKIGIKEQINHAGELLANKNEALRETLNLAFNCLKNPMSLNSKFKSNLELFEKNLTKKRIPKGVGEAFFDEIIDSNECLCGHHMTSEMKENIKKSKTMFLDEENIAIVNPIKTAIKNFESIDNVEDIFKRLITNEREVKIAKNNFDQITQNTEDERFNELSENKINTINELEKVEDWLKNVYDKPFNPQDPPNTECKKTLQKRITDLTDEINKR